MIPFLLVVSSGEIEGRILGWARKIVRGGWGGLNESV